MSENATFQTPDLSTPFANAMKLWQGEMERFFSESEKGLEKTWAMSRKVLEEQARLTEAQMQATHEAMRAFTDGMGRIARVGSESR